MAGLQNMLSGGQQGMGMLPLPPLPFMQGSGLGRSAPAEPTAQMGGQQGKKPGILGALTSMMGSRK